MSETGYYWAKWSRITPWVVVKMTSTKRGDVTWWPFGGIASRSYIRSPPEVIGHRIEEPKEVCDE